MTQSTLSGKSPRMYRLEDNNQLRFSKLCCKRSRSIKAKKYRDDGNIPVQWTEHGVCTVTPRYGLEMPEEGVYFFCHKHVPREYLNHNLVGDWREHHGNK